MIQSREDQSLAMWYEQTQNVREKANEKPLYTHYDTHRKVI